MIEVDEILYRWQKGMSKRRIASSLGLSRNTVKSILSQAKAFGLEKTMCEEDFEKIKESLLALRLNDKKSLRPAQGYIAEQHEQISSWLLTPHMTVTQMVRLFKEENKKVSESSLRRYIREHFSTLCNSTVHLETKPGQQAQVDFASVGLMQDPFSQKMRKAYAFIMTLSYSRYRFVRFVFNKMLKLGLTVIFEPFTFLEVFQRQLCLIT